MPYTYDYPRPAVTADCVVICESMILLVNRLHDPYAGCWALPGGFMEMDETTEQCAIRELREETGVVVDSLIPVGVYSKVDRDPRGRTVSAAYLALPDAKPDATAGDDASAVKWFPIDNLPRLAFDHADIISDALGVLSATGHR